MQPKIIKQGPPEPPEATEQDGGEVVLTKLDFDRMMDFVENPPELPEELRLLAAWYNNQTA